METQTQFWTNVKSLLKDKGLSQADLCHKTNKPLASFQQQIHHNRLPVVDEAYEIALALDTNVEYLLTGYNLNKGDKLAADIQKLLDEYRS